MTQVALFGDKAALALKPALERRIDWPTKDDTRRGAYFNQLAAFIKSVTILDCDQAILSCGTKDLIKFLRTVRSEKERRDYASAFRAKLKFLIELIRERTKCKRILLSQIHHRAVSFSEQTEISFWLNNINLQILGLETANVVVLRTENLFIRTDYYSDFCLLTNVENFGFEKLALRFATFLKSNRL